MCALGRSQWTSNAGDKADHIKFSDVDSTGSASICVNECAAILPTYFPAGVSGDAVHEHSFLAACENDSHRICFTGQEPSCRRAEQRKSKTLLLAYLPRCATEKQVETALNASSIGSPCSVKIVRKKDGESKCFGFARFPTCAAAKAALFVCEKGEIVLLDLAGKRWHIKASWARTEMYNGSVRVGTLPAKRGI
jgi:hypothetical protein